MNRPELALQLHSLRDDCAADFAQTLGQVARIGFRAVEFAGFHGRAPREVRTLLGDAGLACAGAHVDYDDFAPDRLQATLDAHAELGNPLLILPSLPEAARRDEAALRATAARLSDLADTLAARGLRTGFHAHGRDFAPLALASGMVTTAYDYLLAHTPETFAMQMDVGNAVAANVDPLVYFGRYPGRAVSTHLKEALPGQRYRMPVGAGAVEWAPVLATLRARMADARWMVLEVEEYWDAPLECVRQDYHILRNLGA